MAIPAAMLMQRLGRRLGFQIGVAIGIFGLLSAVLALRGVQFAGFCMALALVGGAGAFVQQYRFAAADTATQEFKPRAIAWVMLGGLGAAVIGPQLAIASSGWLSPQPFAGPFLALALLSLIGAIILGSLRFENLKKISSLDKGRPLAKIVRQPRFVVAVICSIGAYGVMSLLMTGAPLAMLHHGHEHAQAMRGIQWHVIAMFAPSFITGNLIARYGKTRIIAVGLVFLSASAGVALNGLSLWHFWCALVLLGIGWNFAFVAATAMLTDTHTDAEKNRVQGLNDFLVFGCVAITSFMSGQAFHHFGWATLNWILFPVIAGCWASLCWLRWQRSSHG